MKKTIGIVGAAVALGLLTSAFSPNVAAAEEMPDLVTGVLYFKAIDAGETATLPVTVKNNGGTTVNRPELYINLGPGLAVFGAVNDPGWTCTQPIRSNTDGSTTINCTSSKALGPDEAQTLALKVHGETNQYASAFYLTLDVDPKSRVIESDESNNTDRSTY